MTAPIAKPWLSSQPDQDPAHRHRRQAAVGRDRHRRDRRRRDPGPGAPLRRRALRGELAQPGRGRGVRGRLRLRPGLRRPGRRGRLRAAARQRRRRRRLCRHAARPPSRNRPGGAAGRQACPVREGPHGQCAGGRRTRGAGTGQGPVPDGSHVEPVPAQHAAGFRDRRFGRDRRGQVGGGRPGLPGPVLPHLPALGTAGTAAAPCWTSPSTRCCGRWARWVSRRRSVPPAGSTTTAWTPRTR